MKYVVEVDGHKYDIEILPDRFLVDGEQVEVDVRRISDLSLYSLLVDNDSVEASVEEEARYQYHVMLGGEMYAITVQPAARLAVSGKAPRQPSGNILRAPMPGLVAAIAVEVGQVVKAGMVLVVLESMKMENPLVAPSDGQVSQIHVGQRQSVDKGQLLVTLAPPEG
ncbi:MAG: biotin/lipoyl-containing protein [Anaerolineae bacterium]